MASTKRVPVQFAKGLDNFLLIEGHPDEMGVTGLSIEAA